MPAPDKKYWKSILFDLMEVAAFNAYILFMLWRAEHPGAINRPQKYIHQNFLTNLIRQLAGIPDDDPIPQHWPGPQPQPQERQQLSGRLTSGKGYPARAQCVRPVIRSDLQ